MRDFITIHFQKEVLLHFCVISQKEPGRSWVGQPDKLLSSQSFVSYQTSQVVCRRWSNPPDQRFALLSHGAIFLIAPRLSRLEGWSLPQIGNISSCRQPPTIISFLTSLNDQRMFSKSFYTVIFYSSYLSLPTVFPLKRWDRVPDLIQELSVRWSSVKKKIKVRRNLKLYHMFCYVLTAPVRHLPSESPFWPAGIPDCLACANEMRQPHIKAPKLSLLSDRCGAVTGSDMLKKQTNKKKHKKNATSKFRDVGWK